jgi:nitroreductase
MSFLNLVKKRYSVRRYKPDPVSEEDLNYILEAGRLAPSWGNRQCWRYVVVKDEERRRKISTRDWISEAPIIIVGCAYPEKSGEKFGQKYYMLDMGISMEHMILAAADRDLGTCWIGGQFDEETVKETLNIPDDVRVVGLFPLGHPADEPDEKERKKNQDFVVYENWQ